MDILSSKLPLAILTTMSLLCVFSHEVKVSNNELELCEKDDRVCVTDTKDCDLRPPSSVQNPLNMSCYYESFESHKSVTCEWSQKTDTHTESDVSLIISRTDRIHSCKAFLTMTSILNITVRVKNYNMESEIWSQLQNVFLVDIFKPPPPDLTVLRATDNSVAVSWRSNDYSRCRLRYRGGDPQSWSETPDVVLPHPDQMVNYTIKDLLPFTVYVAAVKCTEDSNMWSNWSSEVEAKTLETVPWKSPEVCYRVNDTSDSSGRRLLHLTWKTLDSREAGGRVLGYQVRYRQLLQCECILNVTEGSASLEVKGGKWNVTVGAFNGAGYGPAAQLRIDTQRHDHIPSVTNMWVSRSYPPFEDLVVTWKVPPVPPVSHFNVQWHSEANTSPSGWSTVDGSTTSARIQVNDSDKAYLISVVPVYKQQCGSARSLPASVQQGALMEAHNLHVIGVTMTTVTVGWEWQRKATTTPPPGVERYSVMLRDSQSRTVTVTLWPDQWQHTFSNLTPSTEYALHLRADNVSTIIFPVRTDFDKVPVVATAIPLLLLAVAVFIVSILSRTVYKWYFFPHISSPQGSVTGQWLMDPNRQNSTETNVLDIKDFQEVEVLGVKGAILFGPDSLVSSEEDLHEGSSVLQLIVQLSDMRVDGDYVLNSPQTTEHQLHRQTSVSLKEERGQLDRGTSQDAEEALKCFIQQLVANTDGSCADQMICEGDYVVNSSPRAETASGQTLICDADYIANSCFTAKTQHENGPSEESTAL